MLDKPAKGMRFRNKYRRILEIFPGFATWTTFGLITIFSFLAPIIVASFIICYDLYWFLKAMHMMIHLVVSFRRMKENVKIDWLSKLDKIKNRNWHEVYHIIIFPFYKESFQILSTTFDALIKTTYPKDKIIVVLASEERAGEGCYQKTANKIKKRYGKYFFRMYHTIHPADIVGEIKGKSANATWAAREVKKEIDILKIPYKKIIISNLDSDTALHREYLAKVTYDFLKAKKPFQTSYQPIPVYNNNIWDAPAIMRIVATGSAFWHLIESSRRERLRTFSSHSMSFDTLVKVDYWRTDVVNEDSMIFWQCFFHFNGDYQVQPIFIPVSMDTCLAETYIQSFVNQYKQKRRWGYNVEYFPWLFINMIRKKKIPLWTRFIQTYRYVEGNYSWTTGVMIITFFGWFPLIFGDFTGFSRTTMAFTFPSVVRGAMTLALIGLLVQSVISTLLLPKRPGGHSRLKYIFMVAQWVLQPIAGVFFGAIPAIDAQTRLMLGKYMHFFVTSKARRNKEGKIVEGGSDSLTLTRSR
ncbi:hypothetical protein COY23_03095 [bacterium (Candidatus Torokbacteria) CG_4_10_14_0_2_um_filter_35_8]|nr:MAG: hypothetical protein COY23_03095 [bacterium (Candidatus Torokbacteria) CG_4_10_14_0_2_um_filter_35_8]